MTGAGRLERDLLGILDDLGAGTYPDYIDDVLSTTAQRRQRPTWAFPERWLPVEITSFRAATPGLPWRSIGVVAVLAVLIVAVVVAYIGSERRLPAPFGRAANGSVVYAADGDIYATDPETGEVTPLVTGPETDLRPRYSRDGSMVAFERRIEGAGNQSHIYVVRADGSGLTRVTTEPVRLIPMMAEVTREDLEFSPDGQSLLIPTGTAGITIARTDGSGMRVLDLGTLSTDGTVAVEATFRPPDGSEILFIGTDHINVNGGPGVYATEPASGKVRTIVEPKPDVDLGVATWSPDGSQIAYTAWDPTASQFTANVHVIGADGKGDRVLPLPADAFWQGGSFWSNDGSRLLIIRGMTDGYGDTHGVIVPADGSDVGLDVRYDGPINPACCATWEWSPDDSMILGAPLDASGQPQQQIIIDTATGTTRPAPWASTDDPAWQRLAP